MKALSPQNFFLILLLSIASVMLLAITAKAQQVLPIGNPTALNKSLGGFRADSVMQLPRKLTTWTWQDSVGRIAYNPADSSIYYHAAASWYKLLSSAASGITSISQGYGTLLSPNPIISTGSVGVDTNKISTRAWRQKAVDSLNGTIAAKYNTADTGYLFRKADSNIHANAITLDYANAHYGTGSGTVTSVGASGGTGINISGTNPITTFGTFTITNTLPFDRTANIRFTGYDTFNHAPNFPSLAAPNNSTNGIMYVGVTGTPEVDTADLVWNDSLKYLGIHTSIPNYPIDVHNSLANMLALNNTGTGGAYTLFQLSGVTKWKLGYSNSTTAFEVQNIGTLTTPFAINNITNLSTFGGNVTNAGHNITTDTLFGKVAASSIYPPTTSGTVTSVATNNGTGITGGTITTTGIISADTTILSTRAWRQKAVDSLNSIIVTKFNTADTAYLFRKADSNTNGHAITLTYANAHYGTGSGSVTSVATNNGTGITGGTITTSGTIAADTTILGTRAWRQKAVDSLNAIIATKGSGTVTSVATGRGLNGGPITSTGTLSVDSTVFIKNVVLKTAGALYTSPMVGVNTLGVDTVNMVMATQTANTFLGGATSGGAATPTFRALVSADIPDLSATYLTPTNTATLTNKRWTPRVGSTTSSATPTINTDNTDIYKLTAQAADITSFTTNLSGTPNDGDILEIQITGTAARAITWGTSFVSSSVTLPTITVTTATLTVVFQYFTTSSYGNNKWVCFVTN